MLKEVAADTNIIVYLMIIVGVIGVLAKVINQITLRRLVKAAGSMSKSTHKLIKLVRAKYEHACMAHDSVENTNAFVEKYIFEYRGFLFRIHTWRQLELQAIWFSGILAALGASAHYLSYGFNESVFQYIAAEIYMVDYLENICSCRYKKQKTPEKEAINVIAADSTAKMAPIREESDAAPAESGVPAKAEPNLSINIEGEPRDVKKGEEARQSVRRTMKEKLEEQGEPALKEEAIRQILEEFLA